MPKELGCIVAEFNKKGAKQMTKITMWDGAPKEKKKPIEFTWCYKGSDEWGVAGTEPSRWDHIKYIPQTGKYDLFLAWNDGDEAPCLYRGHYNDGVVE